MQNNLDDKRRDCASQNKKKEEMNWDNDVSKPTAVTSIATITPASTPLDSSSTKYNRRNKREKENGNIGDVSNPIFHNEFAALNFMILNELVDFDGVSAYCPKCKCRTSCVLKKELGEGGEHLDKNQQRLRCRNDRNHEFSVFHGTIFVRRVPKNKILLALYLWLNKIDMTRIVVMTGMGWKAVQGILKSIRLACESHYFDCTLEGGRRQIGGPGIIVQIDEAKYGTQPSWR